LALFVFIIGLTFVFDKNRNSNSRIISIGVSIASCAYLVFQYIARPAYTIIDPALFQAFNPMFIVLLGPLAVLMFNWLKSKNIEPSTPAKIGIGMILTAFSFSLMLYPSFGLPTAESLSGSIVDKALAVSPYWLISTYFSITFAELFLSPIGLSFVSKVAPPQMRGSMQAGWYVATAIGNLLAGYVGRFYQHWQLWQFFLLLVVLSLMSAAILFSLLGVINRASEEKE
jgi:POT family proton-dependent oligopeptide transporter